MGRRVMTLDRQAFAEVCIRLERLIRGSGFAPDAVLSVATGGIYVGELLFRGVPHFETRLQRPSTRFKTPRLKGLVRRLPQPVLDAMRVAEAGVLDLLPTRPVDISRVTVPAGVTGSGRILVVDDAVDSGATLDGVLRALRGAAPKADIRSAAVTVTTAHPLARPDYAVFNNFTLIRFPWSMDTADSPRQ